LQRLLHRLAAASADLVAVAGVPTPLSTVPRLPSLLPRRSLMPLLLLLIGENSFVWFPSPA
jgi:hypothetical protein